jgi:hypothetical protein
MWGLATWEVSSSCFASRALIPESGRQPRGEIPRRLGMTESGDWFVFGSRTRISTGSGNLVGDGAVLDHEAHVLQARDVAAGIAADRHQVGQLAGLDRADLAS